MGHAGFCPSAVVQRIEDATFGFPKPPEALLPKLPEDQSKGGPGPQFPGFLIVVMPLYPFYYGGLNDYLYYFGSPRADAVFLGVRGLWGMRYSIAGLCTLGLGLGGFGTGSL